MPKIIKALTVNEVRSKAKQDGVYAVGGVTGLYLSVKAPARSWVLKKQGRQGFNMGLGSYPQISLEQARSKARQILEKYELTGENPVEVRKKEKLAIVQREEETSSQKTFKEVSYEALNYFESHHHWTNFREKDRAFQRLEDYVFHILGSTPIVDVSENDLIKVLSGQRNPKNGKNIKNLRDSSRRKVLDAVHLVFKYAVLKDIIERNPFRSDKFIELRKDVPKSEKLESHKEALKPNEMPLFFKDLMENIEFSEKRGHIDVGAKCLAFAILTNTRSANVRGILWSEIDFKNQTWTIPAQKMKEPENGNHVVFLSDEAMAILRSIPRMEGTDEVFLSNRMNYLGYNAFSAVIKRINSRRFNAGKKGWYDTEESKRQGDLVNITQHGLSRATYKTWALTTINPRTKQYLQKAAVEKSLHHKLEGDGGLGAAYEREEYFQERRDIATLWGKFCMSKCTKGKRSGSK